MGRIRGIYSPYPALTRLEPELRSKLAYSRPANRICNNSEIHTVLEIAARICEVDRIEHIKEIEAKLEAHPVV